MSQKARFPCHESGGPNQIPKRTEKHPPNQPSSPSKISRPKICKTIHLWHCWASLTSQEAKSFGRDAEGPHLTLKKTKNTPQMNRFPLTRFHAASQIIEAQNLPNNPPCPFLGLIHVQEGQVSHGAPIRPPKGRKTPPKSTVFP